MARGHGRGRADRTAGRVDTVFGNHRRGAREFWQDDFPELTDAR